MKYSFKDKNQKITVIGCGYWGTIIAKTLLSLKFKNIYIYDTSYKKTLLLKKKFTNLIPVKKLNQILQDKKILNCFLITPPSKNSDLLKKLIINKKNIFVEKPAAQNLKQLKKIKKLLIKHKNKFMIGYVYCYNDHINKIKKIIKSKELGNILYLNFQRQNLGPIRNDVDVDYDLTTHDLSILLNFFDKTPKLILKKKYSFLKKNISDISNLHLKIDKKIVDINNSWLNPNKIRKITIIGSKKMLLFNELNQENPIIVYNKYAQYPDISFFDKKYLKSKAYIYHGKHYSIKVKKNSPLSNELSYFFKTPNPKTGIDFGIKIFKFLKRI